MCTKFHAFIRFCTPLDYPHPSQIGSQETFNSKLQFSDSRLLIFMIMNYFLRLKVHCHHIRAKEQAVFGYPCDMLSIFLDLRCHRKLDIWGNFRNLNGCRINSPPPTNGGFSSDILDTFVNRFMHDLSRANIFPTNLNICSPALRLLIFTPIVFSARIKHYADKSSIQNRNFGSLEEIRNWPFVKYMDL